MKRRREKHAVTREVEATMKWRASVKDSHDYYYWKGQDPEWEATKKTAPVYTSKSPNPIM